MRHGFGVNELKTADLKGREMSIMEYGVGGKGVATGVDHGCDR